jgi:hypothetical protein
MGINMIFTSTRWIGIGVVPPKEGALVGGQPAYCGARTFDPCGGTYV